MKALLTNTLAGLAGLLLTSTAAQAQAGPLAPTGPYTDTLATGSNVFVNTTADVSASFGVTGMTLNLTNKSGSEFYWGDGGGPAYVDSSASAPAFSLTPTVNQNILTLDVSSITGTLQVGAFFFNSNPPSGPGGNLLTNELGASKGGLNITTAGIYTLNMDTLAAANGLTTATAWKADFFYNGSANGQSATISEFEAGGSTAVPEPSTYLMAGIGLLMLFAVRKFRRGAVL